MKKYILAALLCSTPIVQAAEFTDKNTVIEKREYPFSDISLRQLKDGSISYILDVKLILGDRPYTIYIDLLDEAGFVYESIYAGYYRDNFIGTATGITQMKNDLRRVKNMKTSIYYQV